MKHALKLAVLLDAVLLSLLAFVLLHRSPARPAAPAARPVETQPVSELVAPAVTTSPTAFRWHQLESSDYRVYVKNLRTCGCPEVSVRAIVTADVHAVFARRSADLERALTALAGAVWPARLGAMNSEPALRAEMARLPTAETAEVADLLGFGTAATAGGNAPAAEADNDLAPGQKPVAMPLVFQNFDAKALTLTADQQQVINDVRADFLKEVGGENQDPNDPAYMERWQQAQPKADEMLKFMLGIHFFQDYQMAALGPSQ